MASVHAIISIDARLKRLFTCHTCHTQKYGGTERKIISDIGLDQLMESIHTQFGRSGGNFPVEWVSYAGDIYLCPKCK